MQPSLASSPARPTLRARLQSRREITFTVLAVAACSFSLLQSLIVPVLAQIQIEFDTSQATATWALTGYLISAAVCTPLLGRVGDAVGKVRVLTTVLAVLVVGLLMAGLAPTIGWLIAARVIQGAGGAVFPLAFGIIRDEFRERMTMAMAVIASLSGIGFGVGLVCAGPIMDLLGFRGLFWLPMVVTSLASLAALLFIPESPIRTPTKPPVIPGVLLATWLVALLLALTKGNEWGWSSTPIVGLLVAAVVTCALWIAAELHAPVPLIDMAMMRRRGVWTSNLFAFSYGCGIFGSFGFLPQLVQTPSEAGYGFGASITESGRILLPWAVVSFLIGFATSTLIRRFGARAVILTGFLCLGTGLISIALFHDQAWQISLALILQGAGGGLVSTSLPGVLASSVPSEQTGVANGMNANLRTIGGAVGTAVLAGILTSHLGETGFPVERGYQVGFFSLGVATVAAAFVTRLMPASTTRLRRSHLADAADGELGMVPGAIPSGPTTP